ncbi:hypothetical protein G3I59_29435 [Amycolatopsis rubida]|uniref:DUF304 domain-containing protein n=1 Tax=Amycolatopsis rubida TaxID=112413 RepID=A0ABX0C3H1_9PSEU|nr:MULTISPECIES: hypothetical protein [Amycolatopsis]MYW94603.1 hypothetical protein [Amycolatopsis rubida]NEC59591.1 hypothetical protein [Amycolatopsis rubida]OAP27568.1 hypothetical protein A4R44_01172 [Amycolatopsis sp. M39]
MEGQPLILARALALVLRRRTDVPPDGVAIHYSRTIRPMFWVMLAVNPVDIVLVEVVVKSVPVRIALLVLEVIGALAFLALVATLYKYPHSVSREGLRVRYLSFFDHRIPLASIDSVRQASRSLKTRGGVSVPEDGVLAVGISQATNLSVTLREPQRVDLGRKAGVEITQLDLWADDPRAAVAAIRDQLSASV